MMNKWKKLMAAVCTVSLILTMPGVSVSANEVPEQELISDTDVPQDTVDFLVTVSQQHIMPIQELLNLLHRTESSGMIGL